MAISFELVMRARFWDKKKALEMDFKVGQSILNYPDYYEGVGLLLVKKERQSKP